jgi:predicted dehydrogenase
LNPCGEKQSKQLERSKIMSPQTRRDFLKTSLAAGGVLFLNSRVFGANDRVRVAVAGLNGRGGAHVGEFVGMSDVEIAYLVDPDTRTFAKRLKPVEDKGGKPQCAQDIRRALDDKNVDAISIATPNHWHALMTIWACQAGKDVYVEKPCSHNVFEGRQAVEAARKYNRIVQHGTQSRSSMEWARVVETIKSGKLGKLLVSRGLCYKPRGSIGVKPTEAAPSEVDFNLWLGPAAQRPYHGNLVHYNWHWFWDFGSGDIGNQGVHEMDKARWGIAGATLPKSVVSLGGRFGYTDQGETANTQVALFDYGETQLIFEVRGLKTNGYYDQKIGNIFHLEGGTIAGSKFYPKGSDKPEPLPNAGVEPKRGPGRGNFGNFIAAVRSRKQEDLNADVLEGHYSSALCHLANVSYRLGEEVTFGGNGRGKPFGDDKDANESFERMVEHLSSGNAIPLDGLKYRLGHKLAFDPKAETFVGSPEANRLLTRDYRAPFVVSRSV